MNRDASALDLLRSLAVLLVIGAHAVGTLMSGQWHPIADQVAEDKLKLFLDAIEQSYLRDSARMPEHSAYLSQFAAMSVQKMSAGANA